MAQDSECSSNCLDGPMQGQMAFLCLQIKHFFMSNTHTWTSFLHYIRRRQKDSNYISLVRREI